LILIFPRDILFAKTEAVLIQFPWGLSAVCKATHNIFASTYASSN